MSLSERLKASAISAPRKCKLMTLLDSSDITPEDRDIFLQYMAVPEGVANRLTNVALAKALRAEGFDVADTTVDRHRRGSCACLTFS
jgi:hypothetical protein